MDTFTEDIRMARLKHLNKSSLKEGLSDRNTSIFMKHSSETTLVSIGSISATTSTASTPASAAIEHVQLSAS